MSAQARLHLLMTPSAAKDCFGQLQTNDTVLLLDRGVELLSDSEQLTAFGGSSITLCASAEDAAARGLKIAGAVAAIDDQQFLGLTVDHAQVLSWI